MVEIGAETGAIDLMMAFSARDGPSFEGFIKFKLAHGLGYSVFLPDALFLPRGDEWRWFEPKMFDPPVLAFYQDAAYAQLAVETSGGDEILVATTNDRFVARFDGRSQIFRCRVAGHPDLLDRSTGRAHQRPDGGFDLDLFHHTTQVALEAIQASREVWGSAWNVRGNRKLENVTYASSTSLSKITNDLDLRAIAMASDGVIYFQLDDHTPPAGVVPLKVYRETTTNRTATLALRVPCEAVAGQHVWRHAPETRGVFYESAHPAIYRVGLQPGATLRFDDNVVVLDPGVLKRFDYAVVGDATQPDGILAPYEEEATNNIWKVDASLDVDLLTFWRTRPNQDHFTDGVVELCELGPT